MKRVMMTLAAAMALALAAGPLTAGEAEQENARKFIESLDGIEESVLGEQELDLRMLGHTLGKLTVTVGKAEYEGAECYVVSHEGSFELGTSNRMVGKAYFTPDLSILHSEDKEFTGDTLKKHTVIEHAEGKVKVTVKRPEADDEEDKETVSEFTPSPTLLAGGADMLLYLLLPHELKNYEFQGVDADAGKAGPQTVSAKGGLEKFGRDAFRLHVIETKLNDDGEVNEEETDIFLADGKLIHMESGKGFIVTTGPEGEHTPITREQIEKQDDAIAVAAGFFLGTNDKDKDLLAALIDEVAFMYHYFDNNPETAGMSKEEKQAYAEMAAPTLIESILNQSSGEKDEEEIARDKAVVKLILNRENFNVKKTDDGYRVTTSESASRLLGSLAVGVRKNEDTGKLEITHLESGDDEADAEPEPPTETPSERPSEDEEDF